MQTQPSELKVRHDFFSLRVVDFWNSLPESVVSAPSLNLFKNRLDKCWEEYKFSEDPPQNKSVTIVVSRGAVRSAASSYAAMRTVAGSRPVLVIV